MSRRSNPQQPEESPLPGLSEANQAEIFALLQPGPGQLTLPEMQQQLAARFNLSVPETVIGRFKTWYALRERYRSAEARRRQAVAERRLTDPEESEEQLFAFGQQIFASEALESKDIKAWAIVQRLRQKDIDQHFAARRLAVLESKAAQADATQAVLDEPLTEEEKMAHVRAIFGMSKP